MRKWKELTPRIMESPLLLRKFFSTMDRERKYLQSELAKVAGLMPLLMKPRNKQKWSDPDKIELLGHLKRLSDLSPYLAVVVLPGGFAMLPVLAWWLDRRRGRRIVQPA
jgi:hypothetical protein